jgi:hypothetical protein
VFFEEGLLWHFALASRMRGLIGDVYVVHGRFVRLLAGQLLTQWVGLSQDDCAHSVQRGPSVAYSHNAMRNVSVRMNEVGLQIKT